MDKIKVKGLDYLGLSLLAFGGIGLEGLLAFFIEPSLYGKQMADWSTLQYIFHWCITCIIWGSVAFLLIRYAKNKYAFNIFEKSRKMKLWQWIAVGMSMLFLLIISYSDWNGFKIVKEFENNGWLKFIFQYIYYLFETMLFTLIIVFGQKAFEKWFKYHNIPYGGIVVALTWGLVHILSKGDMLTGILTTISGFVFGVAYLLVNRDIKKTYIVLFLMFVI